MDPFQNPDETIPLRVLTQNCWGLKMISKNRTARMRAIGQAIAASDVDVVALQEVWMEEDYEIVREAVSTRLPYTRRFLSGILGGGLVLLSRYPIIDSEFRPYTLCGSPSRFYHGDWFVGKGMGRCRIHHPRLGPIDILNTHLHAEYGPAYPYEAERASEAWEIGRMLAGCSANTIMLGDFNMVPGSTPYRIIRSLVPARDAWEVVHPSEQMENLSGLNEWEEARARGMTCDTPDNTWAKRGKGLGHRLDYVWVRDAAVGVGGVAVAMTEIPPGLGCSLSDHFGVEATLLFHPGRALPGAMELARGDQAPILELRRTLARHLQQVRSDRQVWYTYAMVGAAVWVGMIVCGGVIDISGLSAAWVVVGGIALAMGEIMLWYGLLYCGKEESVTKCLLADVDSFLSQGD